MDYSVLGVVCSLVIVIFAWAAEPSLKVVKSPRAEDSFYNQLVRGFRAGQLNVIEEVPPRLTRLANPYDPDAGGPYAMNVTGLSYYKGKLYLYFGVTPVLVLLWPYAALTGHYLSDVDTLLIFLSLGFLVAAGLISAVWRRYFPDVSVWVPAVGILSLGLALGTLEAEWWWCDVFQIAQNCGFAFTMLALAAIWRALHDSKRQILWLLSGSLAYGLAIGSRPSALFGAIILLIPAAQAWRAAAEPGLRWRVGLLLAAAIGPLMLIGFGLMLYNFLRFDNPFEFGWRYMLGWGDWTGPQFDRHFFLYNFWYYFCEPMRWSGHFPFLETFMPPPPPAGHAQGEKYCGGIILINYPLIWLALAAPLAWKGRPLKDGSFLRLFVAVVLLLFMICALTFCFFCCCESRYELDFLPALMLVSVIGILGLERAPAGLPARRWIGRAGWRLLLGYSVAVNILAGVAGHAMSIYFTGNFLVYQGRTGEAIEDFRKALLFEPESATFHAGLATAYLRQGRPDDAIAEYEKAFEFETNFQEAATAHNNLAHCFLEKGRLDDAIVQFEKTLALKPGSAEIHNSLGDCFFKMGQMNKAIVEYEDAVKLKPDYAEAQNNLGYSLILAGRVTDAMTHLRMASEMAPNDPDFHNNFGFCLLQTGRVDDAIVQFQKATELRPRFAQAYQNLAEAFRRKGMTAQAKADEQKADELSATPGTNK